MKGVAWFYRAVERADGVWTCRHGLREYDSHTTVAEAIEHLRSLAAGQGPSVVYVHPLGSRPRQAS